MYRENQNFHKETYGKISKPQEETNFEKNFPVTGLHKNFWKIQINANW